MGKRPVPHVVQQDGNGNGHGLLLRNFDAFRAQHLDGLAHQVQRPQRMVEAGVQRPGVHVVREADLLDAAQPL